MRCAVKEGQEYVEKTYGYRVKVIKYKRGIVFFSIGVMAFIEDNIDLASFERRFRPLTPLEEFLDGG